MHMDSKFEILEAKYWAGETSLEEEKLLKQQALMAKSEISEELKQLFSISLEESKISLDSNFESEFWGLVEENEKMKGKVIQFRVSSFLRYAAVGVLAVAISFAIGNFIMKFDAAPVAVDGTFASLEDTYEDPEQAFLEMKRALMFASTKLNSGGAHIKELKRFDEGMSVAQSQE